uniref:Uncharacterized protein n=1 Tax=uncultured marine thaumarchaeote KM3_95_D02 TaxID=1456347 RepID=A0A075HYW4_9ARCH|nr:hypothetical protein [uncultured marine thaumarchaeote KM3_95_D02]
MTFAKLVKDEFRQNKTRTLAQLYDALSSNSEVSLEGTTLKHRIRSAIYGLKQANKVELVGKAKYSVTDGFE